MLLNAFIYFDHYNIVYSYSIAEYYFEVLFTFIIILVQPLVAGR